MYHTTFSLMAPALVEGKERCSHLSQMVAGSLEQMEPMRLVHRCFVLVAEGQRLVELSWS